MKLILIILSILVINLSYSQCNTKLDTVYYYNQLADKVEYTLDLAYYICYSDSDVKIHVNKYLGYSYKQNLYYIHIFRFKKYITSFWREEYPIIKYKKL